MNARVPSPELSTTGAMRAPLAGGRWHFQHGPIDLVLEAWGEAEECARAYEQAWTRFQTVLPELVAELPVLRSPILLAAHTKSPLSLGERGQGVRRSKRGADDRRTKPAAAAAHETLGHEAISFDKRHQAPNQLSNSPGCLEKSCEGRAAISTTTFAAPHPPPPLPQGEGEPSGIVARRMWRACAPLAQVFITPMAAVAGAVADEVMGAMIKGRALRKAYINNGGDIAIHLASGESIETGIVGDVSKPKITARATIVAADPVRGIATSGWRGRSFSLGIADSVTVLARDGAAADAAATLIANAVNVDHPAIVRRPARELDPDSDLREHLVTVDVGVLDERAIDAALANGEAVARDFHIAGHIAGALLQLAGHSRVVGAVGRRSAASIATHRIRQQSELSPAIARPTWVPRRNAPCSTN